MARETLPTPSREATIRAIPSLLLACACLAALAGAAVAPASPAAGQQQETIPRLGDCVRLWAPFAGLAGEEAVWVGRRDGELWIRPEDDGIRSVPSRDVERLEVERRTGSHVGAGALIGGLTGAALTTGFLVVYCSDPDTVCDTGEVFLATAYIGLPALAVGSLVGLAWGRHEWLEVELAPSGGASGTGSRAGPGPGASAARATHGGTPEVRIGVAVPVGG